MPSARRWQAGTASDSLPSRLSLRDCGRFPSEDLSIAAGIDEILALMMAAALQKATAREALGLGEDRVQPWRPGATL